MKQRMISVAALGLSFLMLISIPASAMDDSLIRNLKYYPAAVACLSSQNLPGIAGSGLVDMGAMFMEYNEIENSDSNITPNSSQSDSNTEDYLVATSEDWDELERMLEYCEEPLLYSSANVVNPDKLNEIADVLHNGKIYQFFYGFDGFEKISANEIPELRSSEEMKLVDSNYNSYPSEKIEWVFENIFGLEIERYSERSFYIEDYLQWCYKDGRYYGCTSSEYFGKEYDCKDGWGFDGFFIKTPAGDGAYYVTCKYHNQMEDEVRYQYQCALNYIDGKRYWAILGHKRKF